MIVAGVMSGTSADGINVAIIRARGRGATTRFELLEHREFPFPAAVRRTILSVMNGKAAVSDLARLNFLLGQLYAGAVNKTAQQAKRKLDLIGCHGQTLYHQGEAASFLGHKIACTWQTGEGAVIAAQTGVPVVGDFRPADMAAGGKGAPLVPFLDFLLYRHRRIGRIVLNIGGIANLSAIPAGASAEQVVAFDTGPGNMVIDAVTARWFGKAYDRDGRIAAAGTVREPVVRALLALPYFRRRPPKTAGREEFGREFAADFMRRCGRAPRHDIVATATALTAQSIAGAVRAFLAPREFGEMIVSGGGAKNRALMRMLSAELPELKMRCSDEFGLPGEAKEAAAFALMAYQTWQRVSSNVPSATGAKRAAVLGKVSYP